MDEAMEGLSELGRFSGEMSTSATNIAGPLISAILSVYSLFVIWAMARKMENRTTYVIVWFVAVAFSLLFVLG